MSAVHSTQTAVYFRRSTLKQEDSIDRQRSQVLPYAERQGYVIMGEYQDDGIAGDEFDRRPGFQKLLADAKAGKFQTILVDEPSRFSRQDPIELIAKVVHPLRNAGVRVDTASNGPLDYESLAGIILSVVHADKASGETKTLSRRVLTGLLKKARAGAWTGGIVPYALKVVYGEDNEPYLVPGDEEEVRVLRWIFDQIANHGRTVRWLCVELGRRGVKPPKGNGYGRHKDKPLWNHSTVRRLLRNRKYVGMLWRYSAVPYGSAPAVRPGLGPPGRYIPAYLPQERSWLRVGRERIPPEGFSRSPTRRDWQHASHALG
jgi:DNA invertase Pin-like site-specific DNA recombinase